MTCHSGGALDIYIEPVPPTPLLVVVGRSRVARTLARLGKVLGYHVAAAAPGAEATLFPDADRLRRRSTSGPSRSPGIPTSSSPRRAKTTRRRCRRS
jgi:hypothetical protein